MLEMVADVFIKILKINIFSVAIATFKSCKLIIQS